MLTLFAIPKAFQGHTEIIQQNAIRSWTFLSPPPEIILFGNDKGTAEIAKELNLHHVPDVAVNEFGTPLLSDIFAKAHQLAHGDLLCYANADIIITSDFMKALQKVKQSFSRFLLISKRWDLEVNEPIDFSKDWEEMLLLKVSKFGKFRGVSFVDVFAFTRGLFESIPAFAIGRLYWDSWLVYKARLEKIPVVDATPVLKVIHQIHDYSHIGNKEKVFDVQQVEAQRNLTLYGNHKPLFQFRDTTHLLTPSGLKPAWGTSYLFFKVLRLPLLYPNYNWFFVFLKFLWHLIPRKMRSKVVKSIKIPYQETLAKKGEA
jgi:hypothetical protein